MYLKSKLQRYCLQFSDPRVQESLDENWEHTQLRVVKCQAVVVYKAPGWGVLVTSLPAWWWAGHSTNTASKAHMMCFRTSSTHPQCSDRSRLMPHMSLDCVVARPTAVVSCTAGRPAPWPGHWADPAGWTV